MKVSPASTLWFYIIWLYYVEWSLYQLSVFPVSGVRSSTQEHLGFAFSYLKTLYFFLLLNHIELTAKSYASIHPCLLSHHKGSIFSYSSLSMMLCVSFSYIIFTILQYISSIPNVFGVAPWMSVPFYWILFLNLLKCSYIQFYFNFIYVIIFSLYWF